MSLYVTWINFIKEKAEESWLTESQRETYEALLSRWKSALFVNLHGPPGSGKTFVARLLAKQHDYVYVHDLGDASPGAQQVIVDNAEYSRMMRPLARSLALGRIILISRHPIREAMPQLELTLNPKDVRQFQAVLSDRCDITFIETIPAGEDLAEILRQEVIARGETYVHQRS